MDRWVQVKEEREAKGESVEDSYYEKSAEYSHRLPSKIITIVMILVGNA